MNSIIQKKFHNSNASSQIESQNINFKNFEKYFICIVTPILNILAIYILYKQIKQRKEYW